MERLIHDTAWACMMAIMDKIHPVFTDGEARDAAELLYDAIYHALHKFCLLQARQQLRLHPSNN